MIDLKNEQRWIHSIGDARMDDASETSGELVARPSTRFSRSFVLGALVAVAAGCSGGNGGDHRELNTGHAVEAETESLGWTQYQWLGGTVGNPNGLSAVTDSVGNVG